MSIVRGNVRSKIMSILIKGEKMPKSCGECPCICLNWSDIGCAITASRTNDVDSRLPDCPLVEIPPHGRLIDKGALRKSIEETYCTPCPHDGDYNYCKACYIDDALDAVDDAPTVIESEEE